jgi:phosphoribosylaminoimidazole (AIR) synthetase
MVIVVPAESAQQTMNCLQAQGEHPWVLGHINSRQQGQEQVTLV